MKKYLRLMGLERTLKTTLIYLQRKTNEMKEFFNDKKIEETEKVLKF